MSAFDLTKAAHADLKSIARYTQEHWGPHQRNAYLKGMDQVFHSLAENPVMGKTCDHIREGYRKFPHGAHVIYYKQIEKEDLLIVRILHSTMDVELHIGA